MWALIGWGVVLLYLAALVIFLCCVGLELLLDVGPRLPPQQLSPTPRAYQFQIRLLGGPCDGLEMLQWFAYYPGCHIAIVLNHRHVYSAVVHSHQQPVVMTFVATPVSALASGALPQFIKEHRTHA